MQGYLELEELEDFIEKVKKDDKLRIETKIGTFIAKNEETLMAFDHINEETINIERKIEKKNYRFESAITKNDYDYALTKLIPQNKWEFTLDIIISVTFEKKRGFRIGINEKNELFCYERNKELISKHIDVMDCQKMYRLTLTHFDIIDYKQSDICIDKMREVLKKAENIDCIRYKETKIFCKDEITEKCVFKVQQVTKNKQAFLTKIVQQITDQNNSFKKNVDLAIGLLQKEQNYYKPFYEAEIVLQQSKLAQSSKKITQQYLQLIREFHDSVRVTIPHPSMQGRMEVQKQQKTQFQKQQGNYTKNKQFQNQFQDKDLTQDDILNNSINNTGYHEKQDYYKQQQQSQSQYKGQTHHRGKGKNFHKDREDNSEDEQFNSRSYGDY